MALAIISALSCHTVRVDPAPTPERVAMPDVVRRGGGLYIPWVGLHEAEAQGVTRCLGLTMPETRPTLWVAVPRLYRDTFPILAFYDRQANAIVFANDAPREFLSAILRHEFVHVLLRDIERNGVHDAIFARAVECGFWPAT